MVLGIDLGTSNTLAATISRDGSPVLIPDSFNKNQFNTPSLALIDGRKAFVGTIAENLFEAMPDKQLISFFKRNFGSQIPVYIDDFKNPWFSEAVAALLLKKVIYDADLYLPDGYKKVVITVPANYNDVQRKSVLDAARFANLELTAIIEEPVAAALFYGSDDKSPDDEIMLVYDFGGGTFDLTLITKNGNQLNVIAKDGVNNLGGREFDEIVKTSIFNQYQNSFSKPYPANKISQNRLQKVAEEIKIELNQSFGDSFLLRKWLMVEKDIFESTFSSAEYQRLASQLIEKTEKAVKRCLSSLGMQWSDINKMILTGGSSSSELVKQYWQRKMLPAQQLIHHQPLSSVAKGAAIYAASLSANESSDHVERIELNGVSTYNIGLIFNPESNNDTDLLIHRNTPLPATGKKMYKVSADTDYVYIMLCQYWDLAEGVQQLGTLKAGPFTLHQAIYLEVIIENRLNGTIGVKFKNADNRANIKCEFVKKPATYAYDFQKQKELVESVFLNTYF